MHRAAGVELAAAPEMGGGQPLMLAQRNVKRNAQAGAAIGAARARGRTFP